MMHVPCECTELCYWECIYGENLKKITVFIKFGGVHLHPTNGYLASFAPVDTGSSVYCFVFYLFQFLVMMM
jgi:hypothetical protein